MVESLTVPILALAGGIALLWVGAEALVKGAAELGTRAGISPIVMGLTLVSIGTSAPELAVCILAALQGSSDLAVGNVLGSNLANVGLILGLTAVIRPLGVRPRVVKREVPWMLAVTVLVLPLLWDLNVGRVEGAVLSLILAVYLYSLVARGRREKTDLMGEAGVRLEGITGRRVMGVKDLLSPLGLVLLGSVGLVIGGRAIVFGGVAMADLLGISELIIGLSVVAVGTSLPELATTLVAAFRDEADLAVGNIVGSNIFNLTLVLGGTALISPLAIPAHVLSTEYLAMAALSFLLLPVLASRLRVGRVEGLLLLLSYAAVWSWIRGI